MNIQVQICGLFIILVIMRFFYGNKKLGLFTEKVFSRALLGSFVSLISSISIANINPLLYLMICDEPG